MKNIIFDLGGVIMNLDVRKTIKAFQKLGITNIVNKTGHHST
jgi:glucose-1-phosphatase